MSEHRRGRFVVLEGGEGSGKSTQAIRLARRLDAVLTREPGGTAVGLEVRRLVLDRSVAAVAPRAEALLIAADRAQHVAEVVEPALASGRDVVSDRHVGSSLVYQGIARGLGVDDVRALSTFACAGLVPDVVVVLDVPAFVADERSGDARDRMEDEGPAFHERVRAGYRDLAVTEIGWVLVDGTASVDEVEDAVWDAVGASRRA